MSNATYFFISGNYILQNDENWNKVQYNDIFILCDTSSAPVNIILPEITQEFLTARYHISDSSNNAATNNITITSAGTDTINGSASPFVINTNGGSALFLQNSADLAGVISKWMVVSSQTGGGGGGGFTTADNGLTANTATNVRLGGTLLQNTTIDASTFRLDLTGSGIRTMNISNTNASSPAIPLAVSSISDITAGLLRTDASTNTDLAVLSIFRATSGAALNLSGLGASIIFGLTRFGTIPTPPPATSRISSVWYSTGVSPTQRLAQLNFTSNNQEVEVLNASIRGDGLFTLYQYGLGNLVGTPAYILGVDASGNVVETSVSSNPAIVYIAEAALLALQLASSLDLSVFYGITDSSPFPLITKATSAGSLSRTALLDSSSYSGIVDFDLSSGTTKSISITDNLSNQFLGTFPSAWTLGFVCTYNTFYTDSSGTLGDNCYNNVFLQYATTNTLGDNCHDNTFNQGASSISLGNDCFSNTFKQNISSFTFGNNLQNVTVESGTLSGNYPAIAFPFLYNNPYPATIFSNGVDNYHSYYEPANDRIVLTNLTTLITTYIGGTAQNVVETDFIFPTTPV